MKACMVAYTGYESDNRVRRYAETLVKRGYRVDAVALQQVGQSSRDIINGVRVFRIQRRVRNEKSKFAYLAKLLLFFLRSALFLTVEQIKDPYDLIHIHSVPDFEVFAALYSKLTGTKVILDVHDIVPEFYSSKFEASHSSLIFKMLVAVERCSAAFVDHVIVSNHIWQDRLEQRSVIRSKLTTILNYPDSHIFHRRGKRRNDGKFVIIYPGTLSYHQGVDIAIRAFSLIREQAPEAELHIYGGGDQLDFLKSLTCELGLEDRVFLNAPLPIHEIASVIENADLGVVPKRKDGFGNEAFSTKILEFMSLGVPAVIPNTAIDAYYFDDSIAQFFCAGDERSLADTMLQLIKDPQRRQELVLEADEFVRKYTWEQNQAVYLNLVDSLVNSGGSGAPKRVPDMLTTRL